MGVSKVIINGVTKIDITGDTVAANKLLTGYTAHGADGESVSGSIASKSSTDLTVSGDTVTAPAGYYSSSASKAVASGSATTPATSITANPTISVNSSTGVISASVSASKSVTPTVSAGYVSSGTAGTISVSGSNTSALSTQDGATVSPTESEQTAVAAGKYTLGVVKIGAISSTYVGSGIDRNDSDDLTASGATVTAPAGYYAESASKTIASGSVSYPVATKGTVSNHSISVTPSVEYSAGYISGGYSSGSAVTVSASELVSGTKSIESNGASIDVTNYATVDVDVQPDLETVTDVDPTESSQTITPGTSYDGLASVQINAISSTYVGSDIPQNDSTDLSASGATVTAPTGYYADDATYTISSGSATVSSSIVASPTISVNSSTGVISASVSGSFAVTPTVSAGYISSGTAGSVTLSGSNTSALSTQDGTTVSPTESEQTVVAAGKYTLGAVKVGAISSTYVGSGIDRNDSDDLTASGATVTAPAGYYAESASKTIASGSVAVNSVTVSNNPTITVGSDGLITASLNTSTGIGATVSSGYVTSATPGTVYVNISNTSQLDTVSATTYTPTTTDQTISSGQYLTGAQTILGDSDLIAANIVEGVTIFGVTGTAEQPTAMTAEQILAAVQAGWV